MTIVKRFASVLIATLVLLVLCPIMSPAKAIANCPGGTTLGFVAHEDDDILFLSPDILHDIQNGRCVVTVFVTTGDDNQGTTYWQQREAGAKAAYAQMNGVASAWTQFDAGIPGHPAPLTTLVGKPAISLIFMRLPDGNGDGSGFSNDNFESLQKIWQGAISSVHAVDGTSTYSKQDITNTFAYLMSTYSPDQIRTQDYVHAYGDGDHSDHHTVGYFANLANQSYGLGHTFTGYLDYQTSSLSVNVAGADFSNKQNAFFAYAPHDPSVCQTPSACQQNDYGKWLARQYVAGSITISGSTPNNVGLQATVTASSETPATLQYATKAVDGVIDGYPGDYTKEWATNGEKVGAWLNLTWPVSQTINQIVLYDRPNSDDQITGANLIFSDGSVISAGGLNNNGSPVTINFAPKTITSVRLNITSVSSTTINVGLSEIQVFQQGSGGTSTPTPTPTPTVTPTVTPTPTATATPGSNSFTGQYFSNQNLTGSPTLTRNDLSVNFDWGSNAPDPSLPKDNFSVRWTDNQTFPAGTYNFSVTADDGVRLFLDGNAIINKWIDQPATIYTTNVSLTSGQHSIVMEYYDNTQNAVAKLSWSSVNATPTPTASPTPTPSGTPDANSYTGQYFSNQNLTGSPTLTRNDSTINFNWGLGAPDPSLPNDHFSVRWTKSQAFSAGPYTFSVTADDGVRLKIDGNTVIDKWIDQGSTTYTTNLNLTAGTHTIVMEFYDNTEDAIAKFSWLAVGSTPTPTPTGTPTASPTPTPTPGPSQNGLQGQYFNSTDLSGTAVLTRTDPNVNFDWGMGSPGPGVNSDKFSVRWTGFITPSFTENYTFCSTSDDGERVWVNNQQVLNFWVDQGATEHCGNINLAAGVKVPIKVEFYDNTEEAIMQLSWQSATQPKQVIPSASLSVQ
jgi:LmbE family N-acetylglucosaminyl deacetylase